MQQAEAKKYLCHLVKFAAGQNLLRANTAEIVEMTLTNETELAIAEIARALCN
jgi:hypothetical protein